MKQPAESAANQNIQPADLVEHLQTYLAVVADTAKQQRNALVMYGLPSLTSNPLYKIDPERQFVESITGSLHQFESVRQTLGRHGLILAIQRPEITEHPNPEVLEVAGVGFDSENCLFVAAATHPSSDNPNGFGAGALMFGMPQPEYIPIQDNNLRYLEQPNS